MERGNSLFSFGKYAYELHKFELALHSLELIEGDDKFFWQARYYIALCNWELNEKSTSLDELAYIAQASADLTCRDKARSQYHLLIKQLKEEGEHKELLIVSQEAAMSCDPQFLGNPATSAISFAV